MLICGASAGKSQPQEPAIPSALAEADAAIPGAIARRPVKGLFGGGDVPCVPVPQLAGHDAGRAAGEQAGDDIAEEMPVTRDQQHCGNEQQCG